MNNAWCRRHGPPARSLASEYAAYSGCSGPPGLCRRGRDKPASDEEPAARWVYQFIAKLICLGNSPLQNATKRYNESDAASRRRTAKVEGGGTSGRGRGI